MEAPASDNFLAFFQRDHELHYSFKALDRTMPHNSTRLANSSNSWQAVEHAKCFFERSNSRQWVPLLPRQIRNSKRNLLFCVSCKYELLPRRCDDGFAGLFLQPDDVLALATKSARQDAYSQSDLTRLGPCICLQRQRLLNACHRENAVHKEAIRLSAVWRTMKQCGTTAAWSTCYRSWSIAFP